MRRNSFMRPIHEQTELNPTAGASKVLEPTSRSALEPLVNHTGDTIRTDLERNVMELANSRRIFDYVSLLYIGFLAPLTLGLVIWNCFVGFNYYRAILMLAPVVLASIVAIFGLLSYQQKRGRALADSNDPRIVGHMVELLESSELDRRMRHSLEEWLARLLPRVEVSHAQEWTDRQRLWINRLVNRRSRAVVFAALEALERVGDESAIPLVEKVAFGQGRMSRDPAIRDRAATTLSALRIRAMKRRTAETLLRPAAPVADSGILLQPAAAPMDPKTDRLLRPTVEPPA